MRGTKKKSVRAFVGGKRGTFAHHESAHFYENDKSIDVYIWVSTPFGRRCASARIRRADLADWVRRTGGLRAKKGAR